MTYITLKYLTVHEVHLFLGHQLDVARFRRLSAADSSS